jgi:hypothetical protein
MPIQSFAMSDSRIRRTVRYVKASLLPDARGTAPSSQLLRSLELRILGVSQIEQRSLQLKYEEMVATGRRLPSLEETEFKVFSQTGEDGILHFLFSVVGTEHRRFFEIGIGSGTECNSGNLAKCLFWDGWLVDGSSAGVELARQDFVSHPSTWTRDIKVIWNFVTLETINDLIQIYGIANRIDLLSIDIDGMDYWIWKAMKNISPRVAVVEYNASMGAEKAVTVPYKASFDRTQEHESGFYHGASLCALAKLGKEKGYRLVGCNSSGVNAFFVRNDLCPDLLPEVPVEKAFRASTYRNRRVSVPDQQKIVFSLPLTEV